MIYYDSQLTIHIINHERTKNVDIKYHFVQYQLLKGNIKVKKVSTKDHLADMGTKTVTVIKFKHCLDVRLSPLTLGL